LKKSGGLNLDNSNGAQLNDHSTHKEILVAINGIKSFLICVASKEFTLKIYLKNRYAYLISKTNQRHETRGLSNGIFG